MFQIFSDGILGMFGVPFVNDQVPCGSDRYLVRDIAWQDELTLTPADHDLKIVNDRLNESCQSYVPSFHECKDHYASRVGRTHPHVPPLGRRYTQFDHDGEDRPPRASLL
jgi:hypothetical protein